MISITPPVLYRLTNDHIAVLIDEADNADLLHDRVLRQVINAGWRRGGKVARHLGKNNIAFDVFTPLGLAAIGKLPLPILDRSIVLDMVRAPRNSTTRFDPNTIPAQALVCKRAADMMFAWARDCQLNPNPPIPPELICCHRPRTQPCQFHRYSR